MFDINAVRKEAERQLADEKAATAKKAFVAALRRLDAAKQVVKNIEGEIGDLTASIGDGSFVG
jgi:hypothetical protein